MAIDQDKINEVVRSCNASKRDVLRALSTMGAVGVVPGIASAGERETQSADEFDVGLEVTEIPERKASKQLNSVSHRKPFKSVRQFLDEKGFRLNRSETKGKYVITDHGRFSLYEVPIRDLDKSLTVFKKNGHTWARAILPQDATTVNTNTPEQTDELFISNQGVINNLNNDVVPAEEWERYVRNDDQLVTRSTAQSTENSCYIFDTDTLCAVLGILLIAGSVSVTFLSAGTGTVITVVALDVLIDSLCAINTILQEQNICGDPDLKFCLDGTCWKSFGQWVCTPYPTDLTITPLCP